MKSICYDQWCYGFEMETKHKLPYFISLFQLKSGSGGKMNPVKKVSHGKVVRENALLSKNARGSFSPKENCARSGHNHDVWVNVGNPVSCVWVISNWAFWLMIGVKKSVDAHVLEDLISPKL